MRERRVMTADESQVYSALAQAHSVIMNKDMSDDEECNKRKTEVIVKLKTQLEKLLYV